MLGDAQIKAIDRELLKTAMRLRKNLSKADLLTRALRFPAQITLYMDQRRRGLVPQHPVLPPPKARVKAKPAAISPRGPRSASKRARSSSSKAGGGIGSVDEPMTRRRRSRGGKSPPVSPPLAAAGASAGAGGAADVYAAAAMADDARSGRSRFQHWTSVLCGNSAMAGDFSSFGEEESQQQQQTGHSTMSFIQSIRLEEAQQLELPRADSSWCEGLDFADVSDALSPKVRLDASACDVSFQQLADGTV